MLKEHLFPAAAPPAAGYHSRSWHATLRLALAAVGQWDQIDGMKTPPPSPLEQPHKAAHAWARYRRIMRWMMTITVGLVIGSMILLYRSNGMVSIHFYIATALGIGFTMLLASALMGLAFLSSGTGHDESVIDPLEDEGAK